MIITAKLSDQELQKRIYGSAAEYSKLMGKTFLIIGKNNKTPYFWFECKFEKKNFMHLLGIKSKTYRADAFFDACLSGYSNEENGGITINDCTPSRNHSRTTINEKCSCSEEMFRLKEARYMKIGLKDKISQFVDFTYAYGSTATLGFQKQEEGVGFPITLIPRSIDEFSSQKYKILFVLDKDIEASQYEHVYAEIKEGLFKMCYDELPEELKGLIKIIVQTET
ncbi:MAG: PBECR4 domain-containing protein [Eubacteriales bacterium]|nr:PBECR4 domain-containing protein [Eubacteriales bacterium]